MASYHQYCPLSKALEVVGDRWTLLIVRELMSRGALRYSEIQAGLPGVATNLLAGRLEELVAAGVIRREPAPSDGRRFTLTPRGEALRTVLMELGRWGSPLLEDASPKDAFRMNWMSLAVECFLRDTQPEAPRTVIQLLIGEQRGVVEAGGGGVRFRDGLAAKPNAVLHGAPDLVSSVLFGRMSLSAGRKRGLKFEGDRKALQRLATA